jgi:quercetin dioxygenase-like cupin family protein
MFEKVVSVPDLKRFPDFVRALPEVDLPFPGARGWLIGGTGQEVVFVEFSETIEVPEHQHEEQWELALAGTVDLHCDGTTTRHESGDNFVIPAGKPHGGTVHAGYKALIVFNAPDRYKLKT